MSDQAAAGGGSSEFSKWGYPPVPAPGADYDPGSAPAAASGGERQQPQQQPRAGRQQQQQQQQDKRQQQQQPKGKLGGAKAVALVETPKLEPQPWVSAPPARRGGRAAPPARARWGRTPAVWKGEAAGCA
jgi:hypothetical protein